MLENPKLFLLFMFFAISFLIIFSITRVIKDKIMKNDIIGAIMAMSPLYLFWLLILFFFVNASSIDLSTRITGFLIILTIILLLVLVIGYIIGLKFGEIVFEGKKSRP
ncbi:MAG: hypothetical protein ACE5K4_00275 [Candidatus Hydrothermarchaeota archaeon]